MTNPDNDMMRLKGKALSFKSKSKGSIDVVVRNTEEFSRFIEAESF